MIQHIVLLRLRPDHDAAELQAVMLGLGTLHLPGFTDFTHGPNRDFEGKTANYPYGFIGTFKDADALATYAADPAHQALGARLVALCQGGADGILVADLDVGP